MTHSDARQMVPPPRRGCIQRGLYLRLSKPRPCDAAPTISSLIGHLAVTLYGVHEIAQTLTASRGGALYFSVVSKIHCSISVGGF